MGEMRRQTEEREREREREMGAVSKWTTGAVCGIESSLRYNG